MALGHRAFTRAFWIRGGKFDGGFLMGESWNFDASLSVKCKERKQLLNLLAVVGVIRDD